MRLEPERDFKPLPIGSPVPNVAGFRLHAKSGPAGRREARDRELGRRIDTLLADWRVEKHQFYKTHGVYPRW